MKTHFVIRTVTIGVIGGIYAVGAYDVKIRKNIQHSRNDGMRRTFEELEEKCFIERLGRSSGVMTVFSSFYAGGWIFDNSRVRKVAYIGVESWLVQ